MYNILKKTKTLSSLVILILGFIGVSSCSKSGNPDVEKNVQEYKISTASFSGISSKEVTLSGEIQSIGSESVLDCGFIIQYIGNNGYASTEQTVSLGKIDKVGEYTVKYKPSKPFEHNVSYSYYFYVRTDKNFYKGNNYEFSLNNLNPLPAQDRFSYGRDTIKIEGTFDGLEDNYRINVRGAFEIFSVPFIVSADKKSISFVLQANLEVVNSDVIQVNLVRKDENPRKYQQQLIKITYLAKVNLEKFNYDNLDYLKFYVENLADRYSYIPNLYVLINGKKIPYSKEIRLQDFADFSGTTFKIGYMNGRDSVYYPNPLVLEQPPKDLMLTPSVPRIHPYTYFSYFAPELNKYFWAYLNAKIGDQDIDVTYDYRTETLGVQAADLKEGEYDLKLYNRFYTFTIPKKVKVETLKVTTTGPFSAYIGDSITLKGNFIKGLDYAFINSENSFIGSATAKDGSIAVDLNTYFHPTKKFRVGILNNASQQYIPMSEVISFNSLGFSLDKFYPTKGTTGDVLTIEGHGIGFVDQFLLGDTPITPIKINNNKTTFSIPRLNGKGKMKIGYTINNTFYQTTDYFEYY